MEQLLHYVWKYKLYQPQQLFTTTGNPIEVLDPGIPNSDSGADFFNAKLRIGDILWAGSIEIHDKASDWHRHKHDTNPAYDTVVLHVIAQNDMEVKRTDGTAIPQAILPVPEQVRENINWLLRRDLPVPCLLGIQGIPTVYIHAWMDALLSERLERKTSDVLRLLEWTENDWNEVFYISLTRSFGFGINNDAFEQLARSLSFRCIQKQRGCQTQVEALFFGQAGMLAEEKSCHYYRLLQREYNFLARKYDLKPPKSNLFKNLRVRPSGRPHLKIAQLAAIWVKYDTLFSSVLEAGTPGEIKRMFRIEPSEYWKTHYNFDSAPVEKDTQISDSSISILLINTVIPIFMAYSQVKNIPEYSMKALRLLEAIAPERNSITALFERAGIVCRNAADSQSLIQLKREYCEKKKCLYCRIGFRLLKRGLQEG